MFLNFDDLTRNFAYRHLIHRDIKDQLIMKHHFMANGFRLPQFRSSTESFQFEIVRYFNRLMW